MRKALFVFSIVLLSATAFSQDGFFALRGGLNLATHHQSPSFDYGTLTAGQGGVEIYYGKKSNMLGLSYLYTVKGNKRKNSPTNSRTVLNYLQWDVNYLRFFDAKKATLFAGGGLYLGYALSGRYKSDAGTTKVSFGSNGNFNRLDIGFPVKIGVKTSKLIVGADYDFGVWNILESSYNGSLHNRNFSFYVSYPLTGK